MRHGKKQSAREFWSVKAIARRHRIKMESRLPESKALPPPPIGQKRGVITRLRDGEVAVCGWQAAPYCKPAWFERMVERSMEKAKKRDKYERAYRRRSVRVEESR